MPSTIQQLWFQDPQASPLYINDVAVRIRAGILFIIPLFMGLTLYDVSYTYQWVVDPNSLVDTYETDAAGRILYTADVTKRTYEYTLQTWILLYALFEMLAGLFVTTARFSPTILVSSFLARKSRPIWKPLAPKRFAWLIGASLVSVCLIFFNPDTVADWVNAIIGSNVLPTTENFLPKGTGVTLVWICLSFMWLEMVFGFCVGCQVHALLARLGILKQPCEACNNIDWDDWLLANTSIKMTTQTEIAIKQAIHRAFAYYRIPAETSRQIYSTPSSRSNCKNSFANTDNSLPDG